MENVTVRVNTGEPYEVIIGGGLLSQCGALISQEIKPCRAAVISDGNVMKIYGHKVISSLENEGFCVRAFEFEAGENSKTPQTLFRILDFLAENEFDRNDAVIALGGGVTGDLGGFAAAVYMRGMKLVQIPTSLLAMVDSSVGGKTGVNLTKGKNLAGAFKQPRLVICDTWALKSLDDRQFSCGMAEVVKYSMICDGELFRFLCTAKGRDALSDNDLRNIIAKCVKIKGGIVERDEFEKGERRLLNFGHTVGHAIEKCSGYEIGHGQAVGIGMAVMTDISEKLGFCRIGTKAELVKALLNFGIPFETDIAGADLYEAVLSDKKREGNSIVLVLPERAGKCFCKSFGTDEIKEIMLSSLGGKL